MTDAPADPAEAPEPVPGPTSKPAPGSDTAPEPPMGHPGPRFDRRAPYVRGLLGGLGLLTALGLGLALVEIRGVLVQIVVALFIAAGLDPLVRFLERRGLRRPYAVLVVIVLVLIVLALFLIAIVPVITDQVSAIANSAPRWLSNLQHNAKVREIDNQYHVIERIQAFVTGGDFISGVFGGVLGFGLAVLSALLNTFIITVLTLYFLASMDRIKGALFRLAPASRRDRVTKLGERIFQSVGGYVSGAAMIALLAGVSTLAFLFIVGIGRYAVALAFVVMATDVIPMIGATIGAVIVSAICFATDVKTGIIAVIFYIAYQQFENYVVYPRVMAHSVEIPGVLTVVAALIGAALLGVVGALLAIPTAAAILMIVREVWVRAQDQR